MSHLIEYVPEEKKRPLATLSRFTKAMFKGRYGISFMFGDKEAFVGVVLSNIITEPITRRKRVGKNGRVTIKEYDL